MNLLKQFLHYLLGKPEQTSIVPLFLFISKAKGGKDIPTQVYYALDKDDIYAYAHVKHLTGHIKEDIFTAEQAEELSKSVFFIHPIPKK